MSRATTRYPRGVTLLEVMASMAVLLLGITAALMVVRQTSQTNRRTLTALQAQLIAEKTLEDIIAMGCTSNPPTPCSNIVTSQDKRRFEVWQTATGTSWAHDPFPDDPFPDVVARRYAVAVDVDDGMIPSSIEAGSVGEPAVNRPLGAGQAGNVANVRVSVSWREEGRTGPQVVVLQTRVAP